MQAEAVTRTSPPLIGWAVVTGAGSGIGRSCAGHLASRGFRVACIGRRPDAVAVTVDALEQSGAMGTALAADVTTQDGVDAIAQELSQGPISVLVHAAGTDLVATLAETDREAFKAVMDVNLSAPFFLTQALQPRFVEGSSIVFVSSIAAIAGRDRHSAYGSAKAALLGLTRNLAAELAPRTRVNCLVVGPTRTAMLDEFLAAYAAAHPGEDEARGAARATRLLLGGPAEPAETAATIVHLALDATSTTGAVWSSDTGYTAT